MATQAPVQYAYLSHYAGHLIGRSIPPLLYPTPTQVKAQFMVQIKK